MLKDLLAAFALTLVATGAAEACSDHMRVETLSVHHDRATRPAADTAPRAIAPRCAPALLHNMARGIPASLPSRDPRGLKSPIIHPDDNNAIRALAARVLAKAYCREGDIRGGRGKDEFGPDRSTPEPRAAPMFKARPGHKPWGADLGCAHWHMVN